MLGDGDIIIQDIRSVEKESFQSPDEGESLNCLSLTECNVPLQVTTQLRPSSRTPTLALLRRNQMKDPQSVQRNSELQEFLALAGRKVVVKKTISKSLRSEEMVKVRGPRPGKIRPSQIQLQQERNPRVVSVITSHFPVELSSIITTAVVTSLKVSSNS